MLDLRYLDTFAFVTEYMLDDQETFDKLREEVKKYANDFLNFCLTLDDSVVGIEVEYYHLDSDSNSEDEDIVKWRIKFEPHYKVKGISEKLEGLTPKLIYKAIEVENGEVKLKSRNFDDCLEFIQINFPEYDLNNDKDVEELLKYAHIEEDEELHLTL